MAHSGDTQANSNPPPKITPFIFYYYCQTATVTKMYLSVANNARGN